MRGGYIGHVLVYVIVVRYVMCSSYVLVGLLVLFVSFAMSDGCSLLRVAMYVWVLYWSCLGVCGRCSYCHLRLCLC